MGNNKSTRQPNNLEEKHHSFGQIVKLCWYFITKYDTQVDIHARE